MAIIIISAIISPTFVLGPPPQWEGKPTIPGQSDVFEKGFVQFSLYFASTYTSLFPYSSFTTLTCKRGGD